MRVHHEKAVVDLRQEIHIRVPKASRRKETQNQRPIRDQTASLRNLGPERKRLQVKRFTPETAGAAL